jgi:putative SOS response-associated peptidase YedK
VAFVPTVLKSITCPSTFNGARGTKSKPVPALHQAYGFLTTSPNAVVEPIHPKAMPVILTSDEERDVCGIHEWMRLPRHQRSGSGMARQDCLDVLSGAVAARHVRCILVRQHSAIVVMPSDPP